MDILDSDIQTAQAGVERKWRQILPGSDGHGVVPEVHVLTPDSGPTQQLSLLQWKRDDFTRR